MPKYDKEPHSIPGQARRPPHGDITARARRYPRLCTEISAGTGGDIAGQTPGTQ